VELLYHPLVQRDVREILDWYDERSETAAGRFFDDFESTVEAVRGRSRHGISVGEHAMKIYLRRFPYSITYEFVENTLYVFVLKHQKRLSSHGMRRKRPTRRS
jgi:toxin ParE1/3/4